MSCKTNNNWIYLLLSMTFWGFSCHFNLGTFINVITLELFLSFSKVNKRLFNSSEKSQCFLSMAAWHTSFFMFCCRNQNFQTGFWISNRISPSYNFNSLTESTQALFLFHFWVLDYLLDNLSLCLMDQRLPSDLVFPCLQMLREVH